MKVWGHTFIGHGYGSPEIICMSCGYVVEKGSEEVVKGYIRDREGCELHCGGDWHILKRVSAVSSTHGNSTEIIEGGA